MKLLIALLICLPMLAITGCTRVLPIKHEATVIDYSAERRGTYIFKLSPGENENHFRYVIISEPPPDIAKEITASLGVSADSIGRVAGGEAQVEYANRVIDLAKRSQTLQVLREALFRLAEMGVSADLSPDDRVETYLTVLEFTKTIANAELKQQQAAAHDSFRRLLQSADWTPEQRELLLRRHHGDVPVDDVTKDEPNDREEADDGESDPPSGNGTPVRDLTQDD